ncbi:VCBS repeat-containing protein [Flagellimonas sp.]|uniref:VCBS repeat-containing protein n=1 Tax=Flagellimonas sp. TaxID=2058762 RepID=UPI003BAE2A82
MINPLVKSAFILAVPLLLLGCLDQTQTEEQKRFTLLNSESTGIEFVNQLTESDTLNYFTYQYMYMGGGTAIGDINNDGLADIFLTGNMVANKLYLNQGDLSFDDITQTSGVSGDSRWYTGASLVDINADGYLDIYLSVSGKSGDKHNQLYINNGDLTFSEKAEEYGLDDSGQSIQSTFFDYDHDGDLDLFVINYPITDFKTANTVYKMMMDRPTMEKSDHLYLNNGNGTFTNVTKEAGLLNFGLSVSSSIADYNNDGWDDIYVSNDFSTPDYLYINNGDGTFTDKLNETTKQISFYGMGTDAEDVNNDGLLDLIQVDMAPEDNRRSKANMASMNIGLFWSTVNHGFHYQYMYNSFQLNQGIDANGLPIFGNIGWMAGISSTDWSWAPLIADFDNDGWKDLFITNGTRREINNKDFFKKLEKDHVDMEEASLVDLVDKMPSEKIDNYIFKNTNGIQFKKVNEDWGLTFKGFSNGAAYGDLDNDGDLDLVVNNIDDVCRVFQNNTSQIGDAHYVRVKLVSEQPNHMGVGAKITLKSGEQTQYRHLNPTKGFQSYMEPVLHFGLGTSDKIDSLIVDWNDGSREIKLDIDADQTLTFAKGKNPKQEKLPIKSNPIFHLANQQFDTIFWHSENPYNDFGRQVLLPHKLSNFGPALAVADVNGDKLEDVFIGNGAGFPPAMYLQQPDGSFMLTHGVWEEDGKYEDLGAIFFDANNDGTQDLYVVSGGNGFTNEEMFQDRMYLNFNGTFQKSKGVLPAINGSGSRVIPGDFDKDGDIDLFVGGRISPQNYPNPGQSYLLVNQMDQGILKFENATEELAPGLSNVGMVTDALWTDFDQNGTTDLVVVGEWMPLTIFSHEDGKFIDRTADFGYANTTGWWSSIDGADFDKDGDMDIIAGNLGLNYKYQATPEATFDLYANDFDENGNTDLALGYYNEGILYPVRGRQCSSEQIPAIQLKFKDYNSFAQASLEEVYGKENLAESQHFSVTSFASILLANQGKGNYQKRELPLLAQMSPINDVIIEDFNQDGTLDVILGGNLYASEIETPRNDAGIGLVLLGDGKCGFEPLSYSSSGINMGHDVKTLGVIKRDGIFKVVVANNQGPLQLFSPSSSFP